MNGDKPAFPIPDGCSGTGMDQRTLIAALCMAGYNANNECIGNSHVNAKYAVEDADALLAALAKRVDGEGKVV